MSFGGNRISGRAKAELGEINPLQDVNGGQSVERVRSGQIQRNPFDGGGHESRQVGVCDGKRGAKGDGCGGAVRGGNGASNPSEGVPTQGPPSPRHGDTSPRTAGPTVGGLGLRCRSLRDAGSTATAAPFGPPVWPPTDVAGGVHESGIWGKADIRGQSALRSG